ncbi:MAG: hypothetical protein J7M17_05340 [Anaerolineae bacterium]|nr:hypothetical protein [Anaerolineae bacterium]
MFIFPEQANRNVKIYRGPNIGALPHNDPLPAEIHGEVTLKVGDKVTTDHIMPAGARLKYRSNVPKYAEFVFEGVDATLSRRAAANRDAGIHNIIVAGESYGQGSSREHAALCPMYLGVKAVIAQSFERIHIANLINFGLVPLSFADDNDYQRIAQGDRVRISEIRPRLERDLPLNLVDETQGFTIPLTHTLSARQREILLAGGTLNRVVPE